MLFGFRPVLAPLFRSLVALKRLLNSSTTGRRKRLQPPSTPSTPSTSSTGFFRLGTAIISSSPRIWGRESRGFVLSFPISFLFLLLFIASYGLCLGLSAFLSSAQWLIHHPNATQRWHTLNRKLYLQFFSSLLTLLVTLDDISSSLFSITSCLYSVHSLSLSPRPASEPSVGLFLAHPSRSGVVTGK